MRVGEDLKIVVEEGLCREHLPGLAQRLVALLLARLLMALVLEPEERRLSVELCGSDLLVFPLEQGSRRRR